MRSHFRPEFINRIDEFTVFKALQRKDIKRIVILQAKRVEERLHAKKMKMKLLEPAIEFLAVSASTRCACLCSLLHKCSLSHMCTSCTKCVISRLSNPALFCHLNVVAVCFFIHAAPACLLARDASPAQTFSAKAQPRFTGFVLLDLQQQAYFVQSAVQESKLQQALIT